MLTRVASLPGLYTSIIKKNMKFNAVNTSGRYFQGVFKSHGINRWNYNKF